MPAIVRLPSKQRWARRFDPLPTLRPSHRRHRIVHGIIRVPLRLAAIERLAVIRRQRETVLEPGDLITHVIVPALPVGAKSLYLKLRDRASYEFALASAAVVVKKNGSGRIEYARLAMGGVGTRPWRSVDAEKILLGKPATAMTFRAAAEAALHGAKPQSQNGFKVELAKRCVVHALTQASVLA